MQEWTQGASGLGSGWCTPSRQGTCEPTNLLRGTCEPTNLFLMRFYNSFKRGQPITFKLGAGMVIQG